MHRVDTSGATNDNRFTDGDPTSGIEATIVDAAFMNALQEEIIAVIEGANITLDKASNTQLLAAIASMITLKTPIATTSAVGLIKASTSVLVASDGTATVPAATTTTPGIVELATNDEASAGTDTTRYVNCYQLKTYGLPSGVITMWSGATTAIPAGWALCDGENGTPDLRDRFVMGAGDTYDVGATGGSTTISGTVGSTTLTTAQMPSHTHYSYGNTDSDSNAAFRLGRSASTAVATSSAGSSGSHTHSFTGTEAANLPPYYALAFIMKL